MLKKSIVIFCSIIFAQVAFAVDYWQMNMHKGVTPLSQGMYDLHMVCMAVCAVIGIIVFGIMIYALIYHRKSRGYPAANFKVNPRLEIIWTIIPFLILVGLAIPATKLLFRMDDTAESDVTIKVVGHQWKWEYQYLDQGISYYSTLSTPYQQIQNAAPKGQWYLLEVDKPVVIPVNKKIRFLVTSADVIHSWWVPHLGIKRDAIPGYVYEAWGIVERPGTYRGQCAELCGINHAYMPIVVKAVSQNEFDQWVSSQTQVEDKFAATQAKPVEQKTFSRDELMKLGQEKYELICAACHKPDGTGTPPVFPALKSSSIAVGRPISRHIELVLNGVPGTAMASYKNQLTDEELAAIITYERNAWGNNTNDVVQPADVAKVRAGQNQAPTVVKKAQAGGFR